MGPVGCVLGSLLLYLALTLADADQGPVSREGVIMRGGYGSGVKEHQVVVEGLGEQEASVMVAVGARVYTQEEAEKAFWEIMDTMESRIRGKNPSLMEVQSDLKLPSQLPEYGVRLRWYSSDPAYMDSSGKLLQEAEEVHDLTLFVELSAQVIPLDTAFNASGDRKTKYRQDYEVPVRLLPLARTAREQLLSDFESMLKVQDSAQAAEAQLQLPMEFQGHRLSYRAREKDQYGIVVLLGILAAALLAVRGQAGARERQKKRDRELSMDYADMLSKFVVLVGAGLTVRNAWERMVRDYEEAVKSGRQGEREAYEQMRQTCSQIKSGVSESEAFREFGRRCRLAPYLKFSGILEQNRRAGTKNLRGILQMEMAEALEERKNLARRLGEEAGTKLLLPLFLMLGIIMVMVMVPAMMTMG